jgi:hypothetical protein
MRPGARPRRADGTRFARLVQRLLYTGLMPSTIGFRPTEEDQRIIDAVTQLTGESASDTLRRALRLLDREVWLRQARADIAANADEDISDEPDAW